MLIQNEIIHYWNFIAFIGGGAILCIIMLVSGFLLGSRSYGISRDIPYESGINAVGNTKLRFSNKFYLIAMFFVIFDVETLYLYAWTIAIRESGWYGFIEANIFIYVLLIGLWYLIRIGALDWAPKTNKYLYDRKNIFNKNNNVKKIRKYNGLYPD